MLIKKVNHNTIDTFINTGWENWARFKVKFGKDKNQLFQIKGIKLPKQDMIELERKYNAN